MDDGDHYIGSRERQRAVERVSNDFWHSQWAGERMNWTLEWMHVDTCCSYRAHRTVMDSATREPPLRNTQLDFTSAELHINDNNNNNNNNNKGGARVWKRDMQTNRQTDHATVTSTIIIRRNRFQRCRVIIMKNIFNNNEHFYLPYNWRKTRNKPTKNVKNRSMGKKKNRNYEKVHHKVKHVLTRQCNLLSQLIFKN